MLPSCVPATDLDESGAVLNAEQLRPYYGDPRVLGLAELMNAYGTVRCDPKILQKIRDCTEAGKIVDGHAPLLSAILRQAFSPITSAPTLRKPWKNSGSDNIS